MRRGFDLVAGLAAAAFLVFLVLPLVAIFTRVSPGDLFTQLGSDVAVDALLVSLKTSAIAQAAVLLVGTPAAYVLATNAFRGRRLLLAAVELPIVLPPAVAGLALLAAFAPDGPLGRPLRSAGIDVPLTQTAVVLAVILVAGPFYLRQGIAAFDAVDRDLLDAARTLGARPLKRFVRVALPLAAGGLGAGLTLSLARGLGEFGATIMFAGSLQGRTETLPLMIYGELGRDFEVSLAVGALLVLVSLVILALAKLLPTWTASRSTSRIRSAASTSS